MTPDLTSDRLRPELTRPTLLIVEDMGLAPVLQPALTERGWLVRPTTSVRETIYTAKQHPINAMILALKLPDERGDVAFFRLAAQYPALRRRTIFLVQSDYEQYIVDSQDVPWVRVPTDPETIIQAFAEVCQPPPTTSPSRGTSRN